MIDLLLLGIIPGTNIQINFTDWLIGTVVFLLLVLAFVAHRKRLPASLVIYLVIRRATRHIKSIVPQV
jgi:hypothetical protein